MGTMANLLYMVRVNGAGKVRREAETSMPPTR
jgi:hypothetical protein